MSSALVDCVSASMVSGEETRRKGTVMPLVLKPTIKDFSRAELEAHVAGIRERRMVIAFDYQIGQQLALQTSMQKNERKYGVAIERLGKELVTLDRALAKVEARMDELTTLKQEDETLAALIDSTQVQSAG